MSRPPPGTRDAYRAFQTLPTRWADNDEYGHMNNATYLSFMDTAVTLWQMEQGLVLRGPDAVRFVVVETGMRYHAELGFPDVIHAGLRIGHLGRSSVRFEIGLFANSKGTASAEGHFTQVFTDPQNRPIPVPDPLRLRFEAVTA